MQVLADYTVVPIRHRSGPFAGALRDRALMMPSILETVTSANAYPTLKTLILSHNSLFDDQGVQIVKAFAGNATVERLDLSFNLFGDKTGYALSQLLGTNKTLTQLDFSGNSAVTENSVHELAFALKGNSTLAELVLCHLPCYDGYDADKKKGFQAIAEALETNTTITSFPMVPPHVYCVYPGQLKIVELLNRNKALDYRNQIIPNWNQFITRVGVPQLLDQDLVKEAFNGLPQERKWHFNSIYWNTYAEVPEDLFHDWAKFVDVLTQSGVVLDVMGSFAKDQPAAVIPASSEDQTDPALLVEPFPLSDLYHDLGGPTDRDPIE
ncbi:MAG: hypothetical protein V4492_04545 [Chlamydiota bacterium]